MDPLRQDAGESGEPFSEFFRVYGEKAYNFAYRLVGNEQDARDLVQEAFARSFAHKQRYDASRPFESWLCRILHNIYLDEARRYARKHVVSIDAPAPFPDQSWDEILRAQDADPGEAMLQEEQEAMIQKALEALTVEYRTAVVLCDIEGLSYDEISRVMACPVGTVRSRIHQGRALLRRNFEKLQKGGTRQ